MDEHQALLIHQWMTKANHDLRSARRLYTDSPPLLDTAAYHCQQAAEKALKDYLLLHDIPFRKTHLLAPLLAECESLDTEFGMLAEATEVLIPFATAFRYPGDMLDPEQSDVAEAITLAEAVVAFVLTRMPETLTGDMPGRTGC
ncbi:HEPN domain-containing protein [Thiobaca trueperi]|uniref:HEPN domain-containing protein n=1 Tax=Thiobaca trueperi TaxID=127458 RepID=A0A4R3MUX6_9GAMM|nr:HEPN domain-containing protein [Thiobaca trueperi]TCT19296.1 HEPN domain-containing protein [Thiobaca trueperi]